MASSAEGVRDLLSAPTGEVAVEDLPDELGLVLVHDELALLPALHGQRLDAEAKRRWSSVREALPDVLRHRRACAHADDPALVLIWIVGALLIASGEYRASRTHYLYVKNQNVGQVPGVMEFVAEFVSEAAQGANGYLLADGWIPLKDDERQEMQARTKSLVN